MGMKSQALSTAALRAVIVDAGAVQRFSGKRPPHAAYRLEPVEDQGVQYELAMGFDDDDDDAVGESDVADVNPLYGIPAGVSMLMARDDQGRPAGFITFRHHLHELPPDADGRRRVQYDFKIFVFMVRRDLRGRGFGSALAVSCLSAMRDDLRSLGDRWSGAGKPAVSIRFVGEGKSEGGLMLLDRVARNLGIVSGQASRDSGLDVAHLAAEIL